MPIGQAVRALRRFAFVDAHWRAKALGHQADAPRAHRSARSRLGWDRPKYGSTSARPRSGDVRKPIACVANGRRLRARASERCSSADYRRCASPFDSTWRSRCRPVVPRALPAEGARWRGFHHHVTLCSAAHARDGATPSASRAPAPSRLLPALPQAVRRSRAASRALPHVLK